MTTAIDPPDRQSIPAGRDRPPADSVADHTSGWERWLPRVGSVSAAFTALCCVGVSAALSLASAVGATFLTKDATLKPALAVAIAVTVAGSALTWWRHRNPGPLVVTIAAGIWVYALTFVVGRGGHADHMDDHPVGSVATAHSGHTGLHGGRLALIWVGLGLFVLAQVWDLVRVRAVRRAAHLPVDA